MKRISATKVKNNFGNVLMHAIQDAIIITKNDKDVAVILSNDMYQKMTKIISIVIKDTEVKNNENEMAENLAKLANIS